MKQLLLACTLIATTLIFHTVQSGWGSDAATWPQKLIWFAISLTILAVYAAVLLLGARSARRMRSIVLDIAESLTAETPADVTIDKTASLIDQLHHLAMDAKEQARLRRDLHHQLEIAQNVVARFKAQQEAIIHSSSREMTAQYHAIMGYANYLDERISRHRDIPELRDDFDDACESAFNLKLIAGALDILRSASPPTVQLLPLASVMQNTMLALAASLDRRTMKLNTAEVDITVRATTDATIIAHALWMVLLGLIRHAQPESTLLMGTHYNEDKTRAIISVTVRALAPGKTSLGDAVAPEESATDFASSIAAQANIQLAELLLQQLDASITVTPFSSHACRISFSMPV